MKKRNLIIGSLLAGSLALGTIGIANAGKHGRCGASGQHGGKHHRMFKHLGLNDTQRDQAFKIMHDSKPAKYAKMKQMRGLREQMRNAIHSDSFNAKTVRKLADKKAAIMADLMVLKAQTRNKIYQILTPEQKQKARQFGDRRKHRGYGRGRR